MRCEDCGAPVTAPAKYCSGACRQRAYRRRAREVVAPSPRLDTFVGRHAELADLTKLLARHRIVTVVGPPGVGKSRLVQEAVAHRRHVLLVELADVTRVPDLLGAGPAPGLLVLDGCEHVLADCAALVRHHPATRVLTTSREPLNVPGEVVYRLAPLDQHDAERLFRDRATALEAEFDEQHPLLTTACARLDRLPLALELAARLVRVLTLEEIAARLDTRFAVLTAGPRDASPHHRSLHAAIDRSYQLLDDTERTALRAFAAAPGRLGQRLADTLVPNGWEIARRLQARSLLEDDLTMLESVRHFVLLQHGDPIAPPAAPPVVEDVRGDAFDPLSWHDERLLLVAAMVAEGLTNRQIADGLHVSLRTVENDVKDLKTALGVRSRAQIAAWATQP
ncbi:hypothetical protein BBK82_44905 [Lentzea guizhouensis]|uniref:HTH luxR-type domain-containing protein n=1 Tax=Lentzea guizhouensis TaxID=1586287 RepID=A0A1B2HWC9_9PSEU|nr:LuxR C-terminal-related transcriptional regulator [Lentzea guizhouensis]ANZ42018.1 hypothetical protein BBK82_44905 [Lentzea guizhouensis]